MTHPADPPIQPGVAQAGVAAINPKAGAAAAPTVLYVGDRGASKRRRIAVGILIAYALLMAVPFLWSVIKSFKTLPDSTRLTFVPQPFTLDAYRYLFEKLDPSIFRIFANSAGIALAITLSNLILASLAGYAFARLRFPGREILFLIVLATLMMPDQLRLVPVYLMFNAVGLTRGPGEYLAVVIV